METAKTTRDCCKCGSPFTSIFEMVSDIKDGKQELFHLGCIEDLSNFTTWTVLINTTYNDVNENNAQLFRFFLNANSSESAISTALAQFKVETRPEIFEYAVFAFPETKWKITRIRDPSSRPQPKTQ